MDYGTDFDGVDDIHPSLREVSGQLAVAQAVARRLMTPRGGLFYDRSYGFDVRAYLNAAAPPIGEIVSGVEGEAEKDERVARATATVTYLSETMTISLKLETVAFGTFRLTLDVSELTVSILNLEAA